MALWLAQCLIMEDEALAKLATSTKGTANCIIAKDFNFTGEAGVATVEAALAETAQLKVTRRPRP